MPDQEIASPEVKAVVQFGTKAASYSPTPKAIKIAYRILMLLSGIWVLVEGQFHFPELIAHNIDKYILLGINLIYLICNQFGWVKPSSSETTTV